MDDRCRHDTELLEHLKCIVEVDGGEEVVVSLFWDYRGPCLGYCLEGRAELLARTTPALWVEGRELNGGGPVAVR